MKKILLTLSLVFAFSIVAMAQSNKRSVNKGKAKHTQPVEGKRQAKVRKIRGHHGESGSDLPIEQISTSRRKKKRTN